MTEQAGVRLRWMEVAPLRGILRHELALFKRYYASQSFAAIVEPTFNLLAFGYGFGSLVAVVAGYRYIDFVATGVVGIAALFTSVFPGMFNTYIRRVYDKSYDAMLAAPVDVHELVTGEALWIAGKSAVFACSPLAVAMAFGLDPAFGMLLAPFIVFFTALGFGLFGMWMSTLVPSINSFDYVITGVVTPVFLIGGVFFPTDTLPEWAQAVSQANPIYHCVELIRHAVFGLRPLADLAHLAVLIGFAALMWLLAVRGMRRRLID
jgi:lipooligosaccharide transport system permease protein